MGRGISVTTRRGDVKRQASTARWDARGSPLPAHSTGVPVPPASRSQGSRAPTQRRSPPPSLTLFPLWVPLAQLRVSFSVTSLGPNPSVIWLPSPWEGRFA